ncbi:MAG: metallophosphoesterase [Candidatus Doudnabacteria bacterium RIFCSPHIGHO2_12_FULL_48_11]|nr:MAG: metallophosphoesterase [Candidatus Doudnabacteria bacterium RIFCSPHIGHO2_12_FULL_48_11]
MLKILFFGDIAGSPGRKAVKQELPKIMESEQPDLVLANVENLAHGKGVTVKTIEELMRAGIQGFTGGNHVFSKKEFSEQALRKYSELIVIPGNIPDTYAGSTAVKIETAKGSVLLGNFLGQVFMDRQFPEAVSSPFSGVDEWLNSHSEKFAAIVVDFHAEATSEKIAFGYYLDGRVAAVLGTHTHIPTADAKVLSQGTAYITDVGMCGAAGSVLGVKKELSLKRFLTGERVAFDIPEDASSAELSYVIITIDEQSAKAISIQAVHKIVGLR